MKRAVGRSVVGGADAISLIEERCVDSASDRISRFCFE